MTTIPVNESSKQDVLHRFFNNSQIDAMRNEDLQAGYNVSGVLIFVLSFGTLLGILGMLIAVS